MPLSRLLLVAVVFLALSPAARADNDDLPNFNAPQDNSPLNVDKVNRSLGVTLFKADSLWSEDAPVVARRLGWPQESLTTTQSSYRLYSIPDSGGSDKPFTIFGARAYSSVLYATKGFPTEVSIVFVNQGDYGWTRAYVADAVRLHKSQASDAPVPGPDSANTPDDSPHSTANRHDTMAALSGLTDDDRQQIVKDVQDQFEQALKQDTQTLTDALTKLFGDPQHMGFGGSDSDTRERVLRWDWQGHAFLVSSPKDAYVTLRIVPTAFADNYGKADDTDSDELKTELAQRVKQSDNGDVVVSDIPMVDQGPKGYCVPATWERYLRYLGIPADMYVLANAAGTSQQGTNLDLMVQNVDSLVTLYHRRIDGATGDLDLKTLAKSIDAGLPLMWCCYIHIPFERTITKRLQDRAQVTDWNAWGAKLADGDKAEIAAEITGTPVDGGHQRMIIGYNAKTNEVAISDSWSKAFAIRWMTLDEANAINGGQTFVIEP
jgi:hypothetical protein